MKLPLDADSSRTQSENTVKSYVGHIKQYLHDSRKPTESNFPAYNDRMSWNTSHI